MKVEHLYTTSNKLDQLPLKEGRIIVLTDKDAAYYDMGGQRHLIGADMTEVLKTYYKKTEVDALIKDFQTAEQVSALIAQSTHLTKQIVSSTAEVVNENILYLIKDGTADNYLQYILLNGEAVMIGNTKTDLTDYYKKAEVNDLVKDFQTANQVEELINRAKMLKRKIVGSVTEVISEDYLYLILVDRAQSTYSQWMFIDGQAVMVGTTYVDLSDYSTTDEVEEMISDAISAAISSVYRPKGSVATYDDLPTTGVEVGDVYNVIDTGMNYAWTDNGWDALGETIDLTPYAKKTYVETVMPKNITDLTNDYGQIGLTTVSKEGITKNYTIFAREV